MYKLKHDRYRKARGGKAFVVSLSCAKCASRILDYQKDGDGPLKRCYLNRILAPTTLKSLQHNAALAEPKLLPQLRCPMCAAPIGTPTRHTDGRLAFRLRPGSFTKTRIKQ